jgi:hypothetical protein
MRLCQSWRLRKMAAKIPAAGVDLDGAITINESSADKDFRIESNDNAYQLFVDAGNNKVYMGSGSGNSIDNMHLQLQNQGLTVGSFAGDANSNEIHFIKSRNTTVGSNTVVANADQLGGIIFQGDDGTDYATPGASIKAVVSATPGGNDMPASLVFSTTADGASSVSEHMRINHGGNVGIGTTSIGAKLDVEKSANTYVMRVVNTNGTPYGLRVNYTDGPDNSDNQFIEGDDENATRFRVLADGDVKNHDNSYGSLSDERIKQDIRDSNSQWDDIKAVKVRNFKKKDDVRQYGDKAWEQIGVIAQELETVSPKLIRKHNPSSCDIISSSEFGTLYEDGDTIPEGKKIGDVKEIKEQVKGVSYSVLYMKAIKALQEAMAKIEALETSNTDLKNRVTALEG